MVTSLLPQGNDMKPMGGMLGCSQVVYAVPESNRLIGVSDLRKDGAPAAVHG
jgi:hypothetical protein